MDGTACLSGSQKTRCDWKWLPELSRPMPAKRLSFWSRSTDHKFAFETSPLASSRPCRSTNSAVPRWEQVRSTTRKEWLRARRRERVVLRLIRNDGDAASQIASASRALNLSRSTVYRLLRRYRQAAQTSSLLVGHRGTPQQHRRLSEPREAIVTRTIEEKFLSRPRMTPLARLGVLMTWPSPWP